MSQLNVILLSHHFQFYERQFDTLNIFSDITNREEEKGSSFFQLSETRLYTVLGCILALIIVALLQVTCTIYKTSRKKHNQKVREFKFTIFKRNRAKEFTNLLKTTDMQLAFVVCLFAFQNICDIRWFHKFVGDFQRYL